MNAEILANKKERSKFGIQSPIAQHRDADQNLNTVVSNQKILIMDAAIQQKEYPVGKVFSGYFENSKIPVSLEIIRVSECPNDELEYGAPTVSVLVQWEVKGTTYPENLTSFDGLKSQVNNHFLINPETNNKPGPPIARQATLVKVHASDFVVFDENDAAHYSAESEKNSTLAMPIVAVLDTGLKYKWSINGRVERSFKKGKKDFKFQLAEAKNDCLLGAKFGYCGVTEYLHPGPKKGLLKKLAGLTANQILSSPYDDNKVDERIDLGLGVANGQGADNLEVGRHGTIISAILNEQGCRVLPVKVFNGGGMGTLFDILCGCNYVLSCKRAGTDIKVLNASFSGSLSPEGRELLFRKMKAINERGIWVVAAAGNEDLDIGLTENLRYPAQFGSKNSPNGLPKVITVNSAYENQDRDGNFGEPVSIKVRSSRSGGFASALPIEDDAPLEGTSFAAPYVAAALARVADTFGTKAEAEEYLKSNPIGTVSFENP